MEKCFYSDFILVPFAIIAIFSDTTTAFQILIITMTILCGIFTYMTVNKISGSAFTATISAILYTFCLYRLLDVYHRFAFGEAISFTFIPIVFWGIISYCKRRLQEVVYYFYRIQFIGLYTCTFHFSYICNYIADPHNKL